MQKDFSVKERVIEHGPCFHKTFFFINFGQNWAVVVAQLVEWSLLTPEVHGLNPVIGKHLYRTFVYFQLLRKTKIKKKRTGMAHFFKKW